MSKKKSKKNKTPGILADHKKVGKRFVPPLLQIGEFRHTNWQRHVMPEVIWMAELVDAFGLVRAAELCLRLAQAAAKAVGPEHRKWFAAASPYSYLTESQAESVIREMNEKNMLSELQRGMQTVAHFYPEFPLRFIYRDAPLAQLGDPDLQAFKKRLVNLNDRRGLTATFAQANGVYIAFDLEMLKVSPHISLANFPAIENYPKTEESLKIASAVRTTVTSFVGQLHTSSPTDWPNKFWNRGFVLEDCNIL